MNYSSEGLSRLEEILGQVGKDIVSKFHATSPDFARLIVDFAYGELYSRPALTDRDKELVAVSSLVSQGKTGVPLKAHIKGMMNVGWTKEEIIELLIFLTGCVGFPSTVEAFQSLQEVLAEKA